MENPDWKQGLKPETIPVFEYQVEVGDIVDFIKEYIAEKEIKIKK